MKCQLEQPWVRKLLVLSALAAGGLTTLIVPAYREASFAPEAGEEVSSPKSPGDISRNRSMGNMNVNQHRFIRSDS